MNLLRAIGLISLATRCLATEGEPDMLRFLNGDQLHGQYDGIAEGPSVVWKRDDVAGEVRFDYEDLRQIVLRGGRPAKSLAGYSHVGTVNGDRLPGTIRSLDSKRILLDTEFAGTLEIPREDVGLLAPNPLGGRVLYHGPFAEREWSMISYEHPDGLPDKADAKDGEENEAAPRWKLSGSAWYYQNERMGTALARKSGMPDRAILQFDLAWKDRLSMAIAFHSDFKHPKVDEEDEEEVKAANRPGQPASLPGLFGHSYVLHLYSNYVMLYRTTFDESGKPRLDRVQTNNSQVRLGDSGNARVELRCNRTTGQIILFIDGEFVVQWSELGGDVPGATGYWGKGDGFGFAVQAENSPVRISEIVVAEWNGMPDAARSLQVEDSDIVLLANGTDRFSGKVTEVEDGNLKLESRYGDFIFPMAEIAEVRFAKSSLEKSEEEVAGDLVKVRMAPLGRITGKPVQGTGDKLRLFHASAGEMEVDLRAAVMLEFESSENFIDDWDNDF